MAKTTFLGYVPSLKSKHEATIVGHKAIQSKGGSIRYTLQGEYQGRKTLPKTVSKADFEGVYGFDAKEAEAVIIAGEKDGTSRELAYIEGMTDKQGFTTHVVTAVSPTNEGIDYAIKAGYYSNHAETVVGNPSPASVEPSAPSEKPFPQEPSNENFSAEDYGWVITHKDSGLRTDSFRTKSQAEKYRDELKQNKTLRTGMKIVKANSNDEPTTLNILDYLDKKDAETEVKEALGLFGKKEEKEEEPKTQEFTVVLQEGDKLELTDVEETEAAPDDENEEKEAETLEITDIDWETDDEDVDLPASVLVPSSIVEDEIADYLSDEYGFLVRGYVLNAETYEAVQAKVTRPVKEEEKEESDEGLSTGAKVALGVGALAAGVALFGAEDDYIPYESETDYSRIYEATSGDGYINHDRIDTEEQRMVELRHDSPTTYYNWNSPYDVDESDVDDAVKDELGDEPNEGNYDATVEVLGSKYGENGQKYVDVDVDMETDYGDSRFMGLAAEHESESDGYAYAYTKGHNDGINDEVIYRPSIATDREKNIYKKILRQKADTVGSPSPSGPSSTPEPAEATGSEPSNENMEAEGSNMKMALGILGVGVGAVALLGGDRIKKIFEKLGL